MVEYAIGMDLGGTNLRAAAIDKSGTLLEKISGATNFEEGRDAVIADIVAAISDCARPTAPKVCAGSG